MLLSLGQSQRWLIGSASGLQRRQKRLRKNRVWICSMPNLSAGSSCTFPKKRSRKQIRKRKWKHNCLRQAKLISLTWRRQLFTSLPSNRALPVRKEAQMTRIDLYRRHKTQGGGLFGPSQHQTFQPGDIRDELLHNMSGKELDTVHR